MSLLIRRCGPASASSWPPSIRSTSTCSLLHTQQQRSDASARRSRPAVHLPRHQPFSTSIARYVARGSTSRRVETEMADQIASMRKDEGSLRVKMREMMEQGNIPDDFGLLPGTFIMPSRRNRPSLFQFPKARLRLSYAHLKARARSLFYVLSAKWAIIKPRPKLRTRRIPAIAKALHSRMGNAIASGDETALGETCASGLLESLTGRLRRRPKGETWQWTLDRYVDRVKLISHRAAAMPLSGNDYMVIRQAVVRIRSVQSLAKYNAKGAQKQGGEPKEMTEHVVVQQIYGLGDKMKEWKIWGTVEEDPDLWKQYL